MYNESNEIFILAWQINRLITNDKNNIETTLKNLVESFDEIQVYDCVNVRSVLETVSTGVCLVTFR